MFERYTERARQTIVLAQNIAREFESKEIDVEHILLACYLEEEGDAPQTLRRLGVAEDALRDLISFGKAGKTLAGKQLPFTSGAKDVLDLAVREALGLGHNYITPEHILLALTRRHARALVSEVVDPESLRGELLRVMHLKADKESEAETVRVTFDIEPGQVWLSRDTGESWTVKDVTGDEITLERTIREKHHPKKFVRNFWERGV